MAQPQNIKSVDPVNSRHEASRKGLKVDKIENNYIFFGVLLQAAYFIDQNFGNKLCLISLDKEMNNKPRVLVTGASGYIASHVIYELLQRGYPVVGTVRSLVNKEKYTFLLQFPHAQENLQLREADLLNAESWDKAMEGVEQVMHVASPIPPGIPQDQNELIKPAVEGTVNVVKAAARNNVKKIVFTSSCLTIMVRSDNKTANEEDWSDEKLLHHYPKSKFLAEKAFWELEKQLGHQMEFASALPSLVMGPAFAKHGNSSEAFISEILNGGYPGVPSPSAQYITIDVRDSAVGHIKILQYANAKGRRWILSGDRIQTHQIFDTLREKFGPQGYSITKQPIDAEGIKKSGHGPSLRTLYMLGRKFDIDNSRSITELGLTHRNVHETIIDQAESQIKLGIIKKP